MSAAPTVTIQLRVLGPLEVVQDGKPVTPSRSKERLLLAVLACRANTVVPVDALVECLWGGRPPLSAAKNLQLYVHHLRRTLGGTDRIGFRGSGYVLRLTDTEYDAQQFRILVRHGCDELDAGRYDAAGRTLGSALALWRGTAFLDTLQAPALADEATALEELRLVALEHRIEADLEQGRGTDLIAELRNVVANYPLRERFWAQLMTALYRVGRRAEALAAYREAHRVTVAELGLEPGPQLRELERQLLTDAVPEPRGRPGAAQPGPAPSQLPPDLPTFVGRAAESRRAADLLTAPTVAASVPVLVVAGLAGVGKSALAVRVARAVSDRFPDGQLYAAMHGATPGQTPLQPVAVLGRFLRALGVAAGDVPTGTEEAAALFRSRARGRRMLVVLDDARDAAQVRPLIPAEPGCAVLVTSRRMLASLDGATQLELEVLSDAESVELLAAMAGRTWLGTEPEAAAAVAARCGHLPLALRIAGARLATRPGWSPTVLVRLLDDERRRLDELQLTDLGVRTSFEVSLRQWAGSDDDAVAAFAQLGLPDGSDLGLPAAARLLDRTEPECRRLLEQLVDAQLLGSSQPGRYQMHALIRAYARELAGQRLDPGHRRAALGRLLGHYTGTAWQTLQLLRGQDPRLDRADPRWQGGGLPLADRTEAMAWLEAERDNLLAAAGQAAATTWPGSPAAQLAHALFPFYLSRSYWADWVAVNLAALAAAERDGDRAAQAQILNDLGVAHWRAGDYPQALDCLQRGLARFTELGDRRGRASILSNLGNLHQRHGRDDEALACHQSGLRLRRQIGDRHGVATSLTNIGEIHQRHQRHEQAHSCLAEALPIFQALADRYAESTALGILGMVLHGMRQYDEALRCHRLSYAIDEDLRDLYGQAETLDDIGAVQQDLGQLDEALASHQRSLALRRQLSDRAGEAKSLWRCGEVLELLGRGEEPAHCWQQAGKLFTELQLPTPPGLAARLGGQPGAVDQ